MEGDGKVERVVLERNELVVEDGQQRARATGERETLEAGLVFRAVGYRGVPLPGIPFDARSGLIRTERGRVADDAGCHLHGEYAAGWIKRGPSGVIGTNKKWATDTVNELLRDLTTGHLNAPADPDPAAVNALLRTRTPRVVDWSGWPAIDAAETAAGELQGRPRVKLVTYDALAEAAEPAISSAS